MRPTPGQSPLDQLDSINSHFRSLMKRLRRKYPSERLPYVKVIELHKTGAPHLHVALKAPYIAQRTLSRIWKELTGSPVVDIRAVKRSHGLAKYLAKYLTKATEGIEGRRRWSASPNFLPPSEYKARIVAQDVTDWRFTRARLVDVQGDLLERSGVQIDAELWLAERWLPLWALPPSAPTGAAARLRCLVN